jgi:GNAT superfamily N-acetyltransferase
MQSIRFKSLGMAIGIAVDVPTVNRIVSSAVQCWPFSDRLQRLVLPALHYSIADVQDFEFLLWYKTHACLGVAVWDPKFAGLDSSLGSVALLHGLYVDAEHQREGVGKLLLDEVHRRAQSKDISSVYVKAERFSSSYFEHLGYRRLPDDQGPGAGKSAYPYRLSRNLGTCHSNAA